MRKKGLVSWPYLHPYWYPPITTVPITIPLGSWNTRWGRKGWYFMALPSPHSDIPLYSYLPITTPLGSWNTRWVRKGWYHGSTYTPTDTPLYLPITTPLAPGIQDEVGRAGIMALVIEECHHYPWAPRQSVRPRAACLPIHLLVSINLSVCPLS